MKRFFQQCLEIKAALSQEHEQFYYHGGVEEVFITLADQNPNLYPEVLTYYLTIGDPLRLNPFPTNQLIKTAGCKRSYEILTISDYPTKRVWLFSYYRSLPIEKVKAGHLDHLYTLYQEAKPAELPKNLDFLLKYRLLDKRVIPQVVKIILERRDEDSICAQALSTLFNPYTEVNKIITNLFAEDIGLLKQVYIAVSIAEQFMDHSGQMFNRILDINPDFILEYIDHMYEKKEWLSRYDDTRDYTFLWRRDDYLEIMTRVINHIYECEQNQGILGSSYLHAFFCFKGNNEDHPDPEIRERQDHFLKLIIENRYHDLKFMSFIFDLIVNFQPRRRLPFMALFLNHNREFKDFQKLPLEPNSWEYSESAVPMLQKRAEYLESLLPFLNSVDFLQHKQYIERQIQGIRAEIEREKKIDFMQD